MFSTKCPGQDMRYWTSEDVHEEKCPNCGEVIEFFKTDIRLRCRNCKTRVANPRFDMGCAQWCAHAEMCLGPGAKGLPAKNFKAALEEEYERLARGDHESIEAVQKMIGQAEEKCHRENVDMLPVAAAAVILALIKQNLITGADEFIEGFSKNHTLPQDALKEARMLVEKALEKNIFEGSPMGIKVRTGERDAVKILGELFMEHGKKFTAVN